MNLRVRISVVTGLGFLLMMGCSARKPAPEQPIPPPATQNLIVLMPNEDGTTGKVTVASSGVTLELNEPYEGVRVERADAPPGTPFKVDQDEIDRIFGSALAVMPAAEASFTLYFLTNSTTMDKESQDLLPEIFKTVKARNSTDIEVIGHTDMTGSSESNYALGMNRAKEVVDILRDMGMDVTNVSIASHGDGNPLIPTPKGVSEPRNRRVEVIVR